MSGPWRRVVLCGSEDEPIRVFLYVENGPWLLIGDALSENIKFY